MKYLAVLDYEHLDNSMFLASVGRSLAKQERLQCIMVHGESPYTERLIQTGIMRDEARIRCIRDLNRRLVGLFADQGVPAIGLNGFQRKLITRDGEKLQIDRDYFQKIPSGPVLLLSTLVLDLQTGRPVPIPLPRFVEFLAKESNPDQIFIFPEGDGTAGKLMIMETGTAVPEDLNELSPPYRIISTSAFGELPDLEQSFVVR